jgi:hypothetical protein
MMKEGSNLFRQLYHQHHDIEICIAELKRKGFSQLDTIRVLEEVAAISITDSDKVVRASLAWTS